MPTGADPETVYKNPADGWGVRNLFNNLQVIQDRLGL